MWFALRVTYGRELKFQKLLQEAGFSTFVPMNFEYEFDQDGYVTKILSESASYVLVWE